MALRKAKNAVVESEQDIATLTKEIAYYDNLLKNGGKISSGYHKEQTKHIEVMAKVQGKIGNISNQLSTDYLAKWRDEILKGQDSVASAKEAAAQIEIDKAGLFKTKENFRSKLVEPHVDPTLSPERQKQLTDRILGRVTQEIDAAIREDDAKIVVASAKLRNANQILAKLESKESRAREKLEAEKQKLEQNYAGKQALVSQLRAAQQEAQQRYDQSVLEGVQQRREIAQLAIQQARANIQRARREQERLVAPSWR